MICLHCNEQMTHKGQALGYEIYTCKCGTTLRLDEEYCESNWSFPEEEEDEDDE